MPSIHRCAVLEGLRPRSTLLEAIVAFVIGELLELTLLVELGDGELIVVLRIVDDAIVLIAQAERPLWSCCGGASCIEEDILPATIEIGLYLAGDAIDTCRPAHSTSHRYEEDTTGVAIGLTCLPDTNRLYGVVQRIVVLVEADLLLTPLT